MNESDFAFIAKLLVIGIPIIALLAIMTALDWIYRRITRKNR